MVPLYREDPLGNGRHWQGAEQRGFWVGLGDASPGALAKAAGSIASRSLPPFIHRKPPQDHLHPADAGLSSYLFSFLIAHPGREIGHWAGGAAGPGARTVSEPQPWEGQANEWESQARIVDSG